ncbi:MAG: hypothetical protein RLZZ623_828 [Actinomycetota bacterium]|jgi:NAD(P)-dependent dehydrogenase (short-subunit alcohol dehydrogenase family)
MAELRFNDRVAIVTGAGTGIGAAHARLLGRRGAAVIVNDLDVDAANTVVAEIVAAGGRAVVAPGDIATEAAAAATVDAAIQSFGRVDIVVNNAGVLRSAPFRELTVETWDRVVAVNLRSTFLVTHAAWGHMADQGYGRVISTTSNSGLLGVPGSSAYSAAKAAVWGLTRSLSLEGAELGINVNALAPMAFTAMSAASKIAPKSWRSGEGDEWSRRLSTDHVASAMGWLAHEDCRLNGHVLSVVGGRVARFAMRVTEGFDDAELTIELVRDHEMELLAPDPGVEYGAASDEARAMHRRLLGTRT